MFKKLNIKKKLQKGLFISANIAVAIAITMGVLVWHALGYYKDFRTIKNSREKLVRLSELQEKIIYYDEVLTMSARMAASTGDLSWEARYKKFEPQLDVVIKEAYKYTFDKVTSEGIELTDQANLKLIEMEMQAFKLIKDNKIEEAIKLLSGNAYKTQKKIYAQGLDLFHNILQEEGIKQIKNEQKSALFNFIFSLITFIILVLVWSGGYFLFRNWHKLFVQSFQELDQELQGRIKAETKLKQHQENLEKLVNNRTEELQHTNMMFQKAEEIGAVGSWEWDVKTNNVIYSDNALKLYGIKPEKYDGEMESVFQVFHPEDLPRVQKNIEEMFEEKKSRVYEYRIIKPDKEIRTIGASSKLFFNDMGDVIRLVGHIQDITDRKKAESELQKSESRLKEAQALAKIGSWELKLESNKLFWSDEIFNIFEKDKNKFEATYEAFVETIHPDDRKMVDQAYKNHLVNKKPYNIEHRLLLPDGRMKYVQEQCTSVFNKKGEPTISIGTVQDITEQKIAEEEIKQRTMQLIEAQEIAHLGSFTCDIPSNKTEWSDEQFRIFGLKKQPVTTELMKKHLSPEEAIRMEEEINKAIIEDRPYDMEFTMKRPDGEEKIIHSRGRVTSHDKQGNPLKMSGTNLDITERMKAEEALLFAKEQADIANMAKSNFIANMSHEFRTPMNAILGHAQILNRDSNLSNEQIESVKSINKGGKQLLNVINDVLAMSNIKTEKIKISAVSFHLRSLLNDMIEMFQVQVKAKDLKTKIKLDSSMPDLIYADEKRIRQVLINLLSNAVKFTNTGEIKLGAEENNGLIRICVSDTGIGITKENLETIFGAFEQSYRGRQTAGGTGLGLSISQNFAKLMGGNISVESTPENLPAGKAGGSKFYFTFKYDKGKKEEVNQTAPQKTVIGLKPGIAKIPLLIADDNKDSRDVVVKLLKPFGFNIKEAKDGIEAVELAEKWKPKVILMDVVMSGMDGIETTKKIKSTNWGKDISIIALSGSDFDEDKANILKQGANDFVSKPFNESNLLEKIRHHAGIEYEYEEIKVTEIQVNSAEITKEKIELIPIKLKEDFALAATTGDIKKISELTTEISKINKELANYIQQLADNFETEKIKKLFKNNQ